MKFYSRPHIISTSIAFCLGLMSHSAFAATETVNIGSTGVWTDGTNWSDGSAPATGGTQTNVRLNVNGPITYDFSGVTTVFDASPTGGEARPLGIASGTGTSGTLTVTAGTLTFTTEAGTGPNQGAFITAAADASNNATGLLLIDGGNVVINGATSYLSVMTRGGATSTGTVTINNGSLTVDRIDFGTLSAVAGTTGSVNLNGGTLNVRSISSGNSVMTVNLALNGGTIATTGAPISGQDLIGANIDSATLSGVVTFNTSLGDGVISTALTGTGGITKVGAGALSITNATSYTGPTTVNAGTFATTTAQTGTSKVDVAGGATFGVRLASAGGTFATETLTLGGASGGTLKVDAGSFALSAANPVINTTNFSVGPGTTIQLTGSLIGSGVFPLVDYTGTIGGAGFSGLNLSLSNLPRATASLVNNTAATRIDVQVTNQAIKWIGNVSADWDIDNSSTGASEGTQNWRTETTGVATNYLEGAGSTDAVIFDDTASGPRTINLTTTLSPAAITVNNTAVSGNYTFSGSGSIAGATSLMKNGSGTLVIANTTANTFTGTTTINAGKVQIGDGTTPGVGSLGTGGITMAGGTLEFNRPDDVILANVIAGTSGTISITSSNLTLSGAGTNYTGGVNIPAGRILSLTNTLTLGGTISGAGDISINPASGRIVTLGGNSTFSGSVTVANNTHLRITSGTALGAITTGTTVNGNGNVQDNDPNGGSLQLAGDITVTGESLTIQGTGGSPAGLTAQRGAIQSVSGNNTWAGPITITGASTRIGVQDGASLTLSGTISDGGIGATVIIRGGTTTAGMITLSGTGNMWGQTSVYGSTTRIAGGDDILPTAAPLFVGTNGVGMSIFDLNGQKQRVAGISQVAGTATTNIITNNGTADSVLTVDNAIDRTFIGTLSDGGTNKLSLVKEGVATQTLSGFSTYTGTTTINAGTLLVTGSIAGSSTIVNGGTLAGTGILGGVTMNGTGTFSPGGTMGTTTTGALTLNGNSIFSLEIDADIQLSDLVFAQGNLTLEKNTSPILAITNVGTEQSLSQGTVFRFITYSGTWNGGLFQVDGVPIADNTGSFQLGVNRFAIDYNYVDVTGTSVALVVVPEPASVGLLCAGIVGLLGLRRRQR